MLQMSIFESFNELVAFGGGSIPHAKPAILEKKAVTTLMRTVQEITRDKMRVTGVPDIFEVKVDESEISDRTFFRKLCRKVQLQFMRPLVDRVDNIDGLEAVRTLFGPLPWSLFFEDSPEATACRQVLKNGTPKGSKFRSLPVKVTVAGLSSPEVMVFHGDLFGEHKDKWKKCNTKRTSECITEVSWMLAELYVIKCLSEFVMNSPTRFMTFLESLSGPCNLWPQEYVSALEVDEVASKSLVPMKDFLKKTPSAYCAAVLFQVMREDLFALEHLYYLHERIRCTAFQEPFAYSLFRLIHRMGANDYRGISAEAAEEHRLASDYAASFVDKKNVPEKVQLAMKRSVLRKRFGHVEYDELTDLKSVGQVEQEILEFLERFDFCDLKNHSFRVRRLGKYKAGGIYFSGALALCIDIHSPSTAVHECMHMIDYSMGKLSSKSEFFRVLLKYQDCLTTYINGLDNEHPVKIKWLGSTKYNRDYYQQPTEVFARCSEIYFRRILGDQTSIVGNLEQFAYPKDSALLELIEEYFTKLMMQSNAAA